MYDNSFWALSNGLDFYAKLQGPVLCITIPMHSYCLLHAKVLYLNKWINKIMEKFFNNFSINRNLIPECFCDVWVMRSQPWRCLPTRVLVLSNKDSIVECCLILHHFNGSTFNLHYFTQYWPSSSVKLPISTSNTRIVIINLNHQHHLSSPDTTNLSASIWVYQPLVMEPM